LKTKKRILTFGFSLLTTIGLIGCGGGSGGDRSKAVCADFTYQEDAQAYYRSNNATQLDGDRDGMACESLPRRPLSTVSTTAEGLWTGTTSTGRTITGVVLDNGTYWVLYSAPNNSSVIAGAVQGTGTSANGSFSSSDGRDFNLEGQGINSTTVSASYVAKQSLNGSIAYPSLNQTVTLSSAYNAAYDQSPSLSVISGIYTGSAAVVGGSEAASLTITTTGVITGSGASGCTFNGTATPRAKGNVYNLSVTFGGGACANGTSTVTGIGYFDSASNRLYGTGLNSGRTNGFIFVGTKP
jgi:hypothetical protein